MVPKAFKEVKQQVDIVGKGRVDHGGSSWKGFAVFSRKKPAATDYVKCFMHTPHIIFPRSAPAQCGSKLIQKRLYEINNVSSVARDDIKIQKTVNDVTVTIDYEARVPLFGNVALALDFHKRAVIR